MPCLEDGRPLRRQTTREVIAVDVSAAPQPPIRLRPAETNQHTPVYVNERREQFAKIKPIIYKHVILYLCFVMYKLLQNNVIFSNFSSMGAYLTRAP